MEKFLNKINFLFFVGLISFFFPSLIFANSETYLDRVDKASVVVYCFFADCEEEGAGEYFDELDTSIGVENSAGVTNSAGINADNSSVGNSTSGTVYIDRTQTTQNIIEQTIEKTPIINNTFPTIVNEVRVVEEFDDSALIRKIRNNRSLISQVSGFDTDDDDLSNNNINDLSDVNAVPIAGNVMT